jgi:hypothetical protein
VQLLEVSGLLADVHAAVERRDEVVHRRGHGGWRKGCGGGGGGERGQPCVEVDRGGRGVGMGARLLMCVLRGCQRQKVG